MLLGGAGHYSETRDDFQTLNVLIARNVEKRHTVSVEVQEWNEGAEVQWEMQMKTSEDKATQMG